MMVALLSCKDKPKKPSYAEAQKIESRMVNVNRIIVNNYADSIKNTLQKRNLHFEQSHTGLWYKIYSVGKGDSIKSGQIITISYKEQLFDGKICYSSDSLGLKSFILGRGDIENGLDEGIRKMRVGDSAQFIIPPYLAYGLLGDQKKIPRLAIIQYHVVLQGARNPDE